MREERAWEESSLLDIQNRVENLLWTVSEDYNLDFKVDESLF